MKAILLGGSVCGFLDICAAFVVYGRYGLRPLRLLQGIPGGLLGRSTYEGGLATARLGLLPGTGRVAPPLTSAAASA